MRELPGSRHPAVSLPRAAAAGPHRGRQLTIHRHALTALAILAATVSLAAPPAAADTLDQRFQRHLDALEDARGPWAHWHLAEAQRLAHDTHEGVARLEPLASRLATAPHKGRRGLPWMAGEALGTLASLRHAGNPGEAVRLVRDAGVMSSGHVLGPLRGDGADATDLTVVSPFDPTLTRPGVHGEVGWRYVQDATLTGPLQLADILGVRADAHAWVRYRFDVDPPKGDTLNATVVLSSNGPLASWLDGAPLSRSEQERQFTDWQHATEVALERGAHELWVRTGHATRRPMLMVRIVGPDGRSVVGIAPAAASARGPLATWSKTRRPRPALPDLAVRDKALAGRMALLFDADGERDARALLTAAVEAAPRDAELQWLLSRSLTEDGDAQRAALRRALDLSGGSHVEALADLLQHHRQAGTHARADALSRQLEALDPQHPSGVADRLIQLERLTDAHTAVASLDDIGRWRGHSLVGAVLAAQYERTDRIGEAALAWFAVAQARAADDESVARAVLAARKAGAPELAASFGYDALRRRRWAITPAILLARALAAKNADEGVEALSEPLERHPDSADLHETRGRLLLLAGDQPGAIAAFDTALRLRPQDRELADYRRHLVSGASVAQQHALPLAPILAAASDEPSSRGARYLLDRQVIQVHDSGLSSRFVQRVIAIDSSRAAESFEELSFPFTPGEDRVEVLEAEVLRPDGTRMRPTSVTDHRPGGRSGGVYTLGAARVVSFPTLSAGDIVHMQVRTDEIGSRNLFGAFFGVIAVAQELFPKERYQLIVDAPAGRTLHAHQVGLGAPARDDTDRRQVWRWEATALPAVAVEPRMPGWGDVAAYVNVSTYRDWAAMARWYAELVRPQLELSEALRAEAQQLVEGATSVRERVAAIQEWLVRNTRYVGIEFGIHGFKPYRVTRIAQRGYGDCKDKASLFIAMLDAVGIRAQFVLVRTRDMGRLDDVPATLWAFNHAIAYVPDLDLFVDGTSEFAGLGEVPPLDQGAMALVLDVLDPADPGARLTTIPVSDAAANATLTEGELRVAADGDAVMDVTETIVGTEAPRLRQTLQEPSSREDVLSDVLGALHPGAELQHVGFEGLQQLGAPVAISWRARLPGLVRPSAGGERMDVPLSLDPDDVIRDLGSLATREQPLVIDHPWSEKTKLRVRLPQGMQPDALPGAIALTTPFGRYSLRVKATPGGVLVEEELAVERSLIAPADYPAFRQFLSEIVAARRRPLVVSSAGAR